MDYVTAIAVFVLAYVSYMIGKGSANGDLLTIKRENERLNAELTKLTDVFIRDQLIDAAQQKLRTLTERDSKGRFTGGK